MKLNPKLLTILASGVTTGIATSDTIVADVADASARSNGGSGQSTNTRLFAGGYYADGPGISPIFPFLLPDLGGGNPFSEATVTLELESLLRGPVAFNGDLIGLDRIDVGPNITGEDWGSDGTLLHDDFLVPDSPFGPTTSENIADWLNTQYAGGANAGQFVFIRVDTNVDGVRVEMNVSSYAIATADQEILQKPTINFTTGPGDSPFAIGNIDYKPNDGTVTLTWNKTGAAFYVAKYSLDLTDWGSELDDNITDASDENPDDGELITVTFPLTDLEDKPKIFFRIEEG